MGFCYPSQLILIVPKATEQMQQAEENIIDIQIQRHGSANIVGFATVNNATGIKQDQAGHDQNDKGGDGHTQQWNRQKQVRDGYHDRQNQTRGQKTAHKREVFFADQGIGAQAQKNQAEVGGQVS